MIDDNTKALTAIIPHLPVMLVLDTSHSMWGQGLSDMKHALASFYDVLSHNQFRGAEIDIAAVSLGDNLKMLEEFTPFVQSTLPTMAIRPKGDTPLGAALSLALNKIHEQTDEYKKRGMRHAVPQMIILTDGCSSSDDYTQIASQIRRECAVGQLYCRAIAMGKSPDYSTLQAFAGDNIIKPLHGGLNESFKVTARDVAGRYKGETIIELTKGDRQGQSGGCGFSGNAPQRPSSTVSSSCKYLLDGSNILYWDERESGPCLDIVLAITDDFDRQNIPYCVIFDASARHILRKKRPHDSSKLESLLAKRPSVFKQAPAGIQADVFLLSEASRDPNATIMTNDRYLDHVHSYTWLKQDNSRLMKGMVIDDNIIVLGKDGKNLHFSLHNAEKRAI